MSQPIGAFAICTLEGGLQVYIEAVNVKSFKEIPRAGDDLHACRVLLKDGTWEDSGEPIGVVVTRYNVLVQAARMVKFSDETGGAIDHFNRLAEDRPEPRVMFRTAPVNTISRQK